MHPLRKTGLTIFYLLYKTCKKGLLRRKIFFGVDSYLKCYIVYYEIQPTKLTTIKATPIYPDHLDAVAASI